MLGKVYLTRKDFVKAEAKLAEVTTMGYALLKNFNDLFDYTKDEHHSEYIFDIEYEQGINEGSIFTTQFSLSFQGAGVLATAMAEMYGLPPAGGGDQGCPAEGLFAAFAPRRPSQRHHGSNWSNKERRLYTYFYNWYRFIYKKIPYTNT